MQTYYGLNKSMIWGCGVKSHKFLELELMRKIAEHVTRKKLGESLLRCAITHNPAGEVHHGEHHARPTGQSMKLFFSKYPLNVCYMDFPIIESWSLKIRGCNLVPEIPAVQ